MALAASAPSLKAAFRLELPAPLRLWHLLSLDAPTVASVWCWALAHAAGKPASWPEAAVLFLGTWLLYAGDRLLDSWRTLPVIHQKERHRFHARHRQLFLFAAIPVTLFLLWLVGVRLEAAMQSEGLRLAAITLLYFVSVHTPLRRYFPGPLRLLAVGAIFAWATALPTLTRLAARPPEFLLALAGFALLCALNCAAIERWEAPASSSRDARLSFCLLLFCAAALGAACVVVRPGTQGLFIDEALAALLLFAFHLQRFRLSGIFLRTLADAGLLTPLLLWPWLR